MKLSSFLKGFVFFTVLILLAFCKQELYADTADDVSLVNEKNIESLATACWNLREQNPDSSILLGNQALLLAEVMNDYSMIAKVCNYIGVVYLHYLFDSKSAIPYFHRALESGAQYNDSIQMAYAYNNLGDAFMMTGNVPLALQYSNRSVSIFTELNNQLGIAYGYINMGLVYRNENNFPMALNYLERAKTIREEIGDAKGMASVNLELARVYQMQGKLDKALTSYTESYNRHIKINNLRYAAWCLNGMGNVYYLKHEYPKALDAFKQALELNQRRHHLYGEIEDQIGLSLVYAQLGLRKEGEDALQQAIRISSKMGLHTKVMEAYKTTAEFYQILNDFEKATENFDRFLTLYDSLLSMQQYEILNEVQNNFEIKQRLTKTNHELQIRNRESQYLVIIIGLFIIIIVIVIWRLRSRRIINQQLQTINQTKDKLFSVISHDLKSPFNTLMGFTELLLEDLEKDKCENALEYAGYIKQSAEENLNLLNNLLKWSQAQTGRITFKPELFSLTKLFLEIEEFFKLESAKRRIDLRLTTDVEQSIYADQSILRIVLINLISNALKYTPENGKVLVIGQLSQKKVIIRVEDSGVGMSPEMIEIVFDNTKPTVSKDGLRKEKGTGLGLMLCADLIEIHEGNIQVRSEEGKGSTFEIEIPTS